MRSFSANPFGLHEPCTGTYGSGWRTAGMGIAAGGWCAAAPGTANRGTSAPPSAAGTPPAAGAAMPGSALPGRSRLESLRLYLGGPGGEAPWSIRSGVFAAPGSPAPAGAVEAVAARGARAPTPSPRPPPARLPPSGRVCAIVGRVRGEARVTRLPAAWARRGASGALNGRRRTSGLRVLPARRLL